MPAIALMFVFQLWVLLGISISPISVGQFLSLWTVYLDYIAVAVLTISVITTKQRLLRLIDAILLRSTFIALYGIYGYITKQNGVIDPTTRLFRTSSIFGDGAQTLAMFLSIIIPLAAYRAFTLRGSNAEDLSPDLALSDNALADFHARDYPLRPCELDHHSIIPALAQVEGCSHWRRRRNSVSRSVSRRGEQHSPLSEIFQFRYNDAQRADISVAGNARPFRPVTHRGTGSKLQMPCSSISALALAG